MLGGKNLTRAKLFVINQVWLTLKEYLFYFRLSIDCLLVWRAPRFDEVKAIAPTQGHICYLISPLLHSRFALRL